jgi:RHS repeat-associated protein
LEGATGPWGNLGWTYDNVGNRLTYNDDTGTTDYGYYPGTNRLWSLTGATTTYFTYDENGNTRTEDARQFAYNENNRLAEFSYSFNPYHSIRGEYQYHSDGKRAYKAVTETAGDMVMTLPTVFHYDLSGNLIGESGGDYIYLGSYPIGRGEGPDLYHIHADHLATPRSATDSSGAMVWQLQTRPFGDKVQIIGSPTLDLRFRGQLYDSQTELNQNWSREYDTQLGRYSQPDPSWAPGNLMEINRYGYAAQNPLVFIDPMGLQSCCPADPCPSGEWDFHYGTGWTFGIIFVKTKMDGQFICRDWPENLPVATRPVEVECLIVGVIAAAGWGGEAKPPGQAPDVSNVCNPADLPSTTGSGVNVVIGPISGTFGGKTFSGGASLGLGLGIGWARCTATPK